MNATAQKNDRMLTAALIAAARQGLCFIPVVLLLPRVWGLTGLCVSQAVADILTFFLTLPFLIRTLRDLRAAEQRKA